MKEMEPVDEKIVGLVLRQYQATVTSTTRHEIVTNYNSGRVVAVDLSLSSDPSLRISNTIKRESRSKE